MIYYPYAVVTINPILNDYGVPNFKQPKAFAVQPVNVSVNINPYSEADTATIVLRWEDFPFDPRILKTAELKISIADLKRLQPESSLDADSRFKLFQKINVDNVIFAGYADQLSMTLDSTTREVTINARDYTSIFLDTKFDNANLEDAKGKRTRKISLARPLIAILKDLVSNVPGTKGISIVDRTESNITNVAVASPGFTLLTGQETTDGQNTYVQSHENYWDVIQNLCESVGVICYVELNNIILTRPRILYKKESFREATKAGLPFIFGNNISRLSFKRDLGRKKKFNIVMKSWNIKTNELIKVSIPRDATSAWAKETRIEKAVQKVQTLDAQGNQISKDAPAFLFPYRKKTKEQLIELGQSIYEEIVRQQLEGEFETKEMAITNTQGTEINLAQIKIGTPILLEITQQDIEYISRKTKDGQNISDGKRIAYLIRRGYPPKVAQILITSVAQASGKIRPVFYLRGVNLTMDGSGFTMQASIVNYIELGSLGASGGLVSG